MTGDADFLLRILRGFRIGLLLRFLRRVKQAELLIPIVQNVRPLLAALSELGALQIQDDLSEPFVFFVFPAIFFFENLNSALQHGILLPDFRKNLHKKLSLFHAAFTTLHAGLIRHEGGKILLVFFSFSGKHGLFFSRRFRAFPEQTLSSG